MDSVKAISETVTKNKAEIRKLQSTYYVDKKMEAQLRDSASKFILDDPHAVSVFNEIGALGPKGDAYSIINSYYEAYKKGEQLSALALFCDLEKHKLWFDGNTVEENGAEFMRAAFEGVMTKGDEDKEYKEVVDMMLEKMKPYLDLYQQRLLLRQVGVLDTYNKAIQNGTLKKKV